MLKDSIIESDFFYPQKYVFYGMNGRRFRYFVYFCILKDVRYETVAHLGFFVVNVVRACAGTYLLAKGQQGVDHV